jgi:hypothetical protein
MRAGLVTLLVGAVFVLSGCQYLLGMGQSTILEPVGGSFDPGEFGSFDPSDVGSFDPNGPGFSLPPPLVTYTSGTATVTIDGVAASLGKLNGNAASYADFGTEVTWTDGNGLYLRFGSAPITQSPNGGGYVMIDRIRDGQHWMSSDSTPCTVKVEKMNTSALAGSATCKGLRWMDAMSTMSGPVPEFIAGEPAFDAEITFEAAP